jgi:hypothetical protein
MRLTKQEALSFEAQHHPLEKGVLPHRFAASSVCRRERIRSLERPTSGVVCHSHLLARKGMKQTSTSTSSSLPQTLSDLPRLDPLCNLSPKTQHPRPLMDINHNERTFDRNLAFCLENQLVGQGRHPKRQVCYSQSPHRMGRLRDTSTSVGIIECPQEANYERKWRSDDTPPLPRRPWRFKPTQFFASAPFPITLG